MRLAAIALLLLAIPAARAAEETCPDEDPDEQVVLPGSADAAGALGLDILGGAATLGGVAGCRAAQFATMANPPRLVGYALRGELVDGEKETRAFIDASIAASKTADSWSEGTCKSLRTVAEKMRYHLELLENVGPDGVHLVLGLRPITLVRHVDVTGNLSILELGRDPIFKEEIIRRMRLRPGDAIEDDKAARREHLAVEEQRILEYLARRGYFDAEVEIVATALADPYQVSLDVRLSKGSLYTVGDIEVTGNAAVTSEEIQDLMAQRVCPFDFCLWKGRFSYDRLKSDIDKVRDLYHERGYPGVRVRTDFSMAQSPDRETRTVRLKVTVIERKKLDVAFEGVNQKSEEALKRALTFSTAGAYDDFEALASAEAVRRAYQGDGHFQTLVWFKRTKLGADHDNILFHIDEGNELKIAQISFTGNKTFPEDQLRTIISSKPFPGFFGLIGSGGYVTSLQAELDQDALVAFYRSQGFPHTTVEVQLAQDPALLGATGAVAAQTTAEDGGEPLYLRYDIVEGVRDVVARVDVSCNSLVPSADLVGAPHLTLTPGKPFIAGKVADDAEAIRRVYLERGHLTATVRPETAGSGPDVRIAYKIREGKPVHFGGVIVRGNFKTRAWVVADQLDLDPGDLLTIDALDHGTFQLRSTNLFSSVHPPQLVGRDPVNLVIDVEERHDNLAEADVGFGWSSDYSFFGSAALGFRNLAGIGVAFVLSGELGVTRARAQATLTFPIWVMRRALAIPLQLELTARYRSDETPRFGRLTTEGISATLSRKLGEGVYISFKYDLSRFGRSTELVRPAGADQDLSTSPITTRTASLGPVFTLDRRVDAATGRLSPLTPSGGFLFSAALSVASTYLLGTDDFIKLTLAGQHFLPAGSRVVITNTLRYDQGFPLGDSVLLPDVERFTAGGDTTVRGYEDERLHTETIANPLVPPGDFSAFRVVPAGGNIRAIHNLDVQVRVIDSIGIASAIFLDTGLVMNSWNGFRISKIRQGLGIAVVRWLTPVGSLSLEWAFPLQPELGDDPTGRLHFNFGFVF